MTPTGLGQHVVDGLVVKTTDAAILYQPDDGDEFWVPRKCVVHGAQIEDADEDIAIADWWLKQEKLL